MKIFIFIFLNIKIFILPLIFAILQILAEVENTSCLRKPNYMQFYSLQKRLRFVLQMASSERITSNTVCKRSSMCFPRDVEHACSTKQPSLFAEFCRGTQFYMKSATCAIANERHDGKRRG